MTTAGMGSTTKKGEKKDDISHAATTHGHLSLLTPTSDGNDDQEASGDLVKDKDKLVEHEDRLGGHPEERGEGEVVEEGRKQDTDVEDLHSVNAHQEGHQHEDHGQAELKSEDSVVLLPQLAIRREEEMILETTFVNQDHTLV